MIMKKLLMGVCAFSMLLATGCSNEELVEQIEQQQYTLEVGVGMNSRTYNDENGECNWGENEQIYVFSEDGTVSSVLTLIRKNGKTATFAGTVSGDPKRLKYTVYPVPNKDGKIEMTTIDGNNHNAPMYGSIEGGGAKLSFAGGVVKLDINGAGEGVFRAEGAKPGGGSVTGGHYEFDANDKKLKFVPGTSVVEIKNIPDNGVVFLPVATEADLSAGHKDEVSLTLITPNNGTITGTVKVAQGASTQSEENAFPSVNYDSTSGGIVKAEIEDFDGLKKALSIGGEYELTNDIETSEVLQIGKNVEIKGNGHTVTSSANRVFRITVSKVNVVMNKVKMVSKAVREETNDIRGISIDVNLEGIDLALDTCSVDFTDESAHDWSYAVDVSGNTNHCGITIIGGSYEGANVINVHGTGHGIQIEGTTLTSLYQPNELYYGVCIKLYENGNSVIKNDNKYYGDNAVDFWWPGGKISITGSGDENNTKKVIAKVDEEWFYSLEQAATKQGQIKLFGDVTLSNNIVINNSILVESGKNATVDLNGFDITAPTTDVFEVQGTLNIKGNMESKVQAGLNDNKNEINSISAVWAHNGGAVNIYGGHYVTVADKNGKRNDCIYAGYSQTSAGHINIYDGKFEFDSTNIDPKHFGENEYDGDQFLLNGKDNQGSKITVYGGEFRNHVPGKEAVAPQGVTEVLVSVDNGRKVYEKGTETEITAAHNGEKDVWYVVK